MSVEVLVLRMVLLMLASASIVTLLIYFFGLLSLGSGVKGLLVPAATVLVGFGYLTRSGERREAYRRLSGGIWAGALATLTYDVCRIPVAWSGVPVFKAISYFGTVILGIDHPTALSEIVGWTYHLSNGVGFGVMYAALVPVPRLWSAVAWGLLLEGVMLLTPYAEIFGYKMSPTFLSVTIGAHVVYGVTLWAALRHWMRNGDFVHVPPLGRRRIAVATVAVPLGIAGVALDFHSRHAHALPASPPPYVGSHLYVTWNVPEPDRLAAMWVMERFVEPDARFHFIEPFSSFTRGRPFDVPEGQIRREGARSATEVLLEAANLTADRRLLELAEMTHLTEISPWQLAGRPRAQILAKDLVGSASGCQGRLHTECLSGFFLFLDDWYRAEDDDLSTGKE